MVYWDNLGFETTYTVDAEPEYPADGQWGIPGFEVRGGSSGIPVAVIQAPGPWQWLLNIRFTSVGGLYGTPDPDMICVVDRFEPPTIIDTRNPVSWRSVDVGAIHVAAAREDGLILFADWNSVTAWDGTEVRWRSGPIVEYDVHFRRTGHGRIVCVGTNYESTRRFEVTLDAATGSTVSSREIVPLA